jgi:hypothetical protein
MIWFAVFPIYLVLAGPKAKLSEIKTRVDNDDSS